MGASQLICEMISRIVPVGAFKCKATATRYGRTAFIFRIAANEQALGISREIGDRRGEGAQRRAVKALVIPG